MTPEQLARLPAQDNARGNERRDIFRDDKDRRHFLQLLQPLWGRVYALYI
jgi:hypothetical protein